LALLAIKKNHSRKCEKQILTFRVSGSAAFIILGKTMINSNGKTIVNT
jgi:hypothetical protein